MSNMSNTMRDAAKDAKDAAKETGQAASAGAHEIQADLEALRRQWLSPEPDGRTSLLLQAAWLHSDDRATDKGPEAARLNPNRPPL